MEYTRGFWMDVQKAASFAAMKHAGQKRKYVDVPYVVHPMRVAMMVMVHKIATADLVEAALLHDVLEDTDTTLQELESNFGIVVSSLVEALTNPSKGANMSRAARKAVDRQHLAASSKCVRTVKLLDRLDNVRDCALNLASTDKEFLSLYVEESGLLLQALEGTDPVTELALRKELDALRQRLDVEEKS